MTCLAHLLEMPTSPAEDLCRVGVWTSAGARQLKRKVLTFHH